MKSQNLFKFLLFLSLAIGLNCESKFKTKPPYNGEKIAVIPGARGLFVDSSGDILVVSNVDSSVTAITEVENEDGGLSIITTVLVEDLDLELNHGVRHHKNFLYASSSTTVFRWPYVAGTRKLITEKPEIVIQNIPAKKQHRTRTLLIDEEENLIVSIGSAVNFDYDPERALIRRFRLDPTKFPIECKDGEIIAEGVRNEVALGFDSNYVLWGAGNARDRLVRADLGGDIHNTNPAEEIHRFETNGNHGYPFCWSTDVLEGYARGTQFADPNYMDDGVHTDEWCRNASNNIPPIGLIPAHSAPLGFEFYNGIGCESVQGSFPCSSKGDAFIALHGSWNSDYKVGYRVTQLEYRKTGPRIPTGKSTDLIFDADLKTCSACFCPVHAVFTHRGHMIITDDQNDDIIRVTFDPTNKSN